jgi:ketosteroid isomerase-like protein
MKRALIAIAFLAVTHPPALCRQTPQGAGDEADAVRAVMKLEGKWVRAVLRRDAKALSRILADEYRGTGSDGEVHDKARTPAELRTAAVGFESLKPYDFDVRVDGDTTTVTGRVPAKVMLEGEVVSSRFGYTRIYVKRKGRWRVVASRTTRIDEQ